MTEFETEVLARLSAIEAKLPGVAPEPPKVGQLYQFVRPLPVEPRYGLGVRMEEPDAAEAIKRAAYCVRWNGDVAKVGNAEDEAWAEIEALKISQSLQEKYKLLDPEFAGFALLTNLLEPSKYDGFVGASIRDNYQGATVQSFLDQQFGVDSSPSGDE